MENVLFKEKYMPFHLRMYRTAYRILSNQDDAEDMVQEAYIRLWNKRHELNYIENIESYCVVLIRNLSLDLLKYKSRHLTQSIEESILKDSYAEADDLESEDDVKYLASLIERLPLQQKKVIELRHIENYSLEEIEDTLNLSSINVRVLLSRGRKKLRELIESKIDL